MQLEDSRVISKLISLLGNDPVTGVRMAAATALGEVNPPAPTNTYRDVGNPPPTAEPNYVQDLIHALRIVKMTRWCVLMPPKPQKWPSVRSRLPYGVFHALQDPDPRPIECSIRRGGCQSLEPRSRSFEGW